MSAGLGRNDPCHCGSGKKYKHCHLEADEKAARDARAAARAEASPAAAAPAPAQTSWTPADDPTMKQALAIFVGAVVLGVLVGVMTTASTGFTVAGAGGLIALLYAGLKNPPQPHENPGDPAALNFGMTGGGDADEGEGQQPQQPRRRGPSGPTPPRRRR